MVQSPFCRLLPLERRQGNVPVSNAGHITVGGSRRHVDVADDTIADTAVEIAFFSDDVMVNLDGLGRNADIF